MIPVCRYGQTWADWRRVGGDYGRKKWTERLTLEEGEEVTALTGECYDSLGYTEYLDVMTSTGRRWQKGSQMEDNSDYSLRPSPALGRRLSHLSGSETKYNMIFCCHWTCD